MADIEEKPDDVGKVSPKESPKREEDSGKILRLFASVCHMGIEMILIIIASCAGGTLCVGIM